MIAAWLGKILVWSVIYKLIKKVVLWFLIISLSMVFLYKWVPVPVTFFMLQRCVAQKAEGKPMKLKKDWERFDNISNHLALGVVCAEDQNFLTHSGFDFNAIEKAIKYNDKMEDLGKTKRRGASTISQQTAKNVFLWHGRSWVRKGLEVYFTFLIETFWSKERIMEVYLNVIELGDGVYGAEAASKEFFNKNAKNLSIKESAILSVVLPNPRKYSAKNPGSYVLKRTNWCIKQMNYHNNKLIFE